MSDVSPSGFPVDNPVGVALVLGEVLVTSIMDIVRRHRAANNGEVPTDAQVQAQLQADITEGRGAIAEWFASKDLPTPPAR